MGRVGVCMSCVRDSEEREDGVGPGVNATILSETLQLVVFAEVAEKSFHPFACQCMPICCLL